MTVTVSPVLTGIEWGYGRVSTKKQDLHRQIHALTTSGIPDGLTGDAKRLYVDKLTGKDFNRREWLELRPRMRAGDVLTLPELDRLGRSQTEMLQLFTELTNAKIHVQVIGGPIPFDTRVAGPATEMAKALLIFLSHVELIYKQERVASARESGKTAHRPRKLTPQLEDNLASEFATGKAPVDQLAASYGVSRATVYRIAREYRVKNNTRRTVTPPGRGKSLTPGQIATARRLKTDGMSIRAIAEAVGSTRATIHRALTGTTGAVPTITAESTAALAATARAGTSLTCPGCGAKPNGKIAVARLQDELQTDWWSTTDTNPARIQTTQHCSRCQPHTVYAIACLNCGDGPLLTGQLAELARDTEPDQLPDVVTDQLATEGWLWATTSYGTGWICNTHTWSGVVPIREAR